MTDSPALRALVVDWGGVLTVPLDAAMTAWARTDGVDYEHFRDVMRGWVGVRSDGPAGPVAGGDDETIGPVAALEQAADSGPAHNSPVHRLERGELSTGQFEGLLAAELGARGSTVAASGLLDRMLGDLSELADSMVGLVRRARLSGLSTALLSNSWGEHYPAALFEDLFDAVVISGRVGMRKPEERIYRHTADLLGLSPRECVLVDDLPHNIRGASAVGMVGVLHTDYPTTLAELEILFARRLADPVTG